MPESLLHSLLPNQPSPPPFSPPSKTMLIMGALGVIVAGVIVGFLLTKTPLSKKIAGISSTPAMINTENEVGSTDTQTFRDTATGTVESGGLNGEGTHKLLREGGSSQTVYLVSSIVDLEQFTGKKVQVWGETVKGQKAAWLMDVGRIKILE